MPSDRCPSLVKTPGLLGPSGHVRAARAYLPLPKLGQSMPGRGACFAAARSTGQRPTRRNAPPPPVRCSWWRDADVRPLDRRPWGSDRRPPLVSVPGKGAGRCTALARSDRKGLTNLVAVASQVGDRSDHEVGLLGRDAVVATLCDLQPALRGEAGQFDLHAPPRLLPWVVWGSTGQHRFAVREHDEWDIREGGHCLDFTVARVQIRRLTRRRPCRLRRRYSIAPPKAGTVIAADTVAGRQLSLDRLPHLERAPGAPLEYHRRGAAASATRPQPVGVNVHRSASW